jgi:recombination protein RecA
MAKAKTAEVVDVNEELQERLAEANLGNLVRTIDQTSDIDVDCTSTGLLRLDKLLHKDKLGLAEGRDVEIHSDDSEVGKTSLALQIGAAWQAAGKSVAVCDIAGTITTPYMTARGFILDRRPGIYLPLWMETEMPGGKGPKPAEEILDNLRSLVNTVDLIIVDDVPCLIQASDLEKDADENGQTGGIAKHLTQHMRKTTHKRATVLWINQRREKIGRTMPGMPAKKLSMAGQAIPFWSSIRLTLTRIGKIEVGSDDSKESVGMKVQIYSEKNKVSPPFKKTVLTYLDDDGFSPKYDYFDIAIKAKIIEKSGTWYSFDGQRLAAGENNSYQVMKNDDSLFQAIKTRVHETVLT